MGGNVDVSYFNDGQQLPGEYTVSISVNKARNRVGVFRVDFQYDRDDELSPRITKDELRRFGINPDRVKLVFHDGGEYIDFSRSEIRFSFSYYAKALTLHVPDRALEKRNNELAHESLWDDGINALMLNYDARGYHRDTKGSGVSGESWYLSVAPALNIGSWRFRQSGIWRQDYYGRSSWQSSQAYAETDIRSLKSKLLAGESSTGSDIFDSVPFTGIQLSTSENMIPYHDRAFSPSVRGVAGSVAQVDVRQNGYLIYSTEVPAGPFELTDVPASEGTDLDVTVTEADGRVQRFTVPYNTPAISVKSGHLKYEATAGEYRPSSDTSREDRFGQFSVIYGISDLLTGYAGVQASEYYRSGAVGAGFNFGSVGAVSVDGLWSRDDYSEESGEAYRVRYSKRFNETGTTFSLAGYRYASEGYRTFSEAMERSASGSWREKHEGSATVRQDLSDYGSLDLSLRRVTYWNGKDNDYGSLNYSTSLYGVGMSLGWSRVLDSNNDRDDTLYAYLSVPLRKLLPGGGGNNTSLSYRVVSEKDNSVSNTVSLSGTAYENRMSWNASHRTNSRNHNNDSTSLNGSFRHMAGTLSGMFTHTNRMSQYGAGMSGSLVVHGQGITAGQKISGNAAVLVDAGGVEGLDVYNRAGVKTDGRGFAVVPSVSAYRKTDIRISQAGVGSETEIRQTVKSVVPTSGALVLADYDVVSGKKALLNLMKRDGRPVPFGAVVSAMDEKGNNTGIVGASGEVYLSGLADSGRLKVRWGEGADGQCEVAYELHEGRVPGLYSASGQCL
ncbi:fimbrial biogenesis outer membrane usher protein [Escherichia coli]|nr:fimbrial biogenesis outer membrane usher protein [Escherichia coli]EHR8683435.1 fimbrial biogenesis outer membrane usher protein [Escherichia coli]EHR8987838.1 fimbrial biogenesis outer membrane usher protein [Escherichia coli]EHR9097655.1 fimbrial biogenesis outer membrane usher protein [Escherichia coli]EIM2921422.1 fimbrial biogenesis outer membrane usher protein [Escherichia coli]